MTFTLLLSITFEIIPFLVVYLLLGEINLLLLILNFLNKKVLLFNDFSLFFLFLEFTDIYN